MHTPLYHAAEHIAAEGGTQAEWRQPLYAWATDPPEGKALGRLLHRGLLVVAALLFGAGLIFWIAANWQGWSRGAKLGLLEAALVALLVVACIKPRARNAALLGGMLVLGGLLAFIGQTYQTGADAWQLFAAWAALSLLWVLMARSDLLWTLWVAIAALALALWTGPIGLMRWFSSSEQHAGVVALTMLAWWVLAVLPIAVHSLPWLRISNGLGRWSHRLAVGLALAAWTGLATSDIFWRDTQGSIAWPMAAILVGGMFWIGLRSRWRDLPSLALALLAANVLVMVFATHLLLRGTDEVAAFLLLGVLGLVCLGASATWLLRQQQTWSLGERK